GARRSAFAVFILPSITLNADIARPNPQSINFVTFLPVRQQVTAQMTARYDLFLGGQKFAELTRSGAALEAAHAGELEARFAAAQLTESEYYAVLADAELLRVARERLQRAEQQLAVARARVVSGAAVQTDSLQLRLELTQARVGQLLQESALRIARLELGRRVGAVGPVDAAPLDTAPAPDLPITLGDAISHAATEGPQYRVARANQQAAEGLLVARENFRVQQSRYRAGATTILDLLKAQSDLDDAEAVLVQARYATRLALAGLETILGRRLFPEPQQK